MANLNAFLKYNSASDSSASKKMYDRGTVQMKSESFRICILVAVHDGSAFYHPQHLRLHLLFINVSFSEPMSPHFRYSEQHTGKVHPRWFKVLKLLKKRSLKRNGSEVQVHNCDQQQQASGKRSHLSPGNAGVPLPRRIDGRNDKVKPIEILLVDDLTHHLVIELQTQIQPAIDREKLSAPCAGL